MTRAVLVLEEDQELIAAAITIALAIAGSEPMIHVLICESLSGTDRAVFAESMLKILSPSKSGRPHKENVRKLVQYMLTMQYRSMGQTEEELKQAIAHINAL